MSWLTRCYMSIADSRRHKLSDCYDWHKLVWECFPGRPEHARDFLFRVNERPEGAELYLLSAEQPQPPSQCALLDWHSKEVPARFLEYDQYHFDILCNPCRKVTAFTSDGKPKKNSRREALLRQDEQQAWFLRTAQAHGFTVVNTTELRIDPSHTHTFRKVGNAGTHIAVRFCGTLRVQDRERFCHAFHHGIGSARGFGFGLMLLAPIHTSANTANT